MEQSQQEIGSKDDWPVHRCGVGDGPSRPKHDVRQAGSPTDADYQIQRLVPLINSTGCPWGVFR